MVAAAVVAAVVVAAVVVAVVGAHCVVVGAVAVGGCRGGVGFLPCVVCPVLVGWGWVVVSGCWGV